MVLFGMEFTLRSFPNSYKLKSNYLNNNASSVETLILGSSHSYYGIDPKYFNSETFNAANISQSPYIDFTILKSYEKQLKGLKNIVIRLSYDTLFEQLRNTSEDWRLKDYKLYTTIALDYKFRHNSEVLSLGTSECLRVLKNYYLNDIPLLNCDSLGWGNNLSSRPKVDLKNAGEVAAKKHTAQSWNLLDENISNFKSLMKWCKERNIKVFVVSLPMYKSYRDNIDNAQFNKMIEVGENLEAEFTNCKYFNYTASEKFSSNHFYDGDHLNANGAEKFSIIINNLIEN